MVRGERGEQADDRNRRLKYMLSLCEDVRPPETQDESKKSLSICAELWRSPGSLTHHQPKAER